MKSKLMLSCAWRIAAPALLVGLVWLTSGSATAQNLLKNGDFEQELGPDNWTIVYTAVVFPTTASWPKTCGPNDFEVQGRTRLAHKDKDPGTWDGDGGGGQHFWNKFGGHFRAGHDWLMHAYFKQVVTNLSPGAKYVVSCWMTQYEGPVNKAQLFLEALGGPGGTTSVCYPPVSVLQDTTDAGYLQVSAFNNPTNWAYCVVTNTASNQGKLEVRLHYNKRGSTSAEKWRNMDALYDHAAVMLDGTQAPQPAYQILSLAKANEDVTLQWETVMNNSYRIQVSSDLTPWATFLGPYPWVDPDFLATGTAFTFTTNVLANSIGNPYYVPNTPLFFRISAKNYDPNPWYPHP
jgi:hypothetical protein